MVLYCNFRSLAFLGLLGFLRRQLKTKFIATLLSAAKSPFVEEVNDREWCLSLGLSHISYLGGSGYFVTQYNSISVRDPFYFLGYGLSYI